MPGTPHHSLTDKATRGLALLTVCGLAGLAGWISYHHMLLLARRAGDSGIDAHAFPLTVDGLDVMCILVLLADRRTGRRSGWLPWTVLAVGTAASISANIAVAPDNLVARAISGWSAIALLAAVKMLAHLFEPAPPAPHADVPGQVPPAAHGSEPGHRDDDPDSPSHRTSSSAGRLPIGAAAVARWQRIWHGTKHLDAATAEAAAAHGVSLRTLQFIRAAGEEGHLDLPPLPAAPPEPARPDHHDTATA